MIQRGNNADRHLCQKCRYKAKGSGCDYFCKTDKVRPCDAEYCFLWMIDDPELQKNTERWRHSRDNNKKEERQDDAVYKNLANAIIKRAADDYVDAQIQIHKIMSKRQHLTRDDIAKIERHKHSIGSCRSFFESSWFYELTELDSESIIKGLDAKVEKIIEEEGKKHEK